jgi:hypothetical protein
LELSGVPYSLTSFLTRSFFAASYSKAALVEGFFTAGYLVILQFFFTRFHNFIEFLIGGWTQKRANLKFIYSEKATIFCKISTLLLTVCTVVGSKVEILQNFVAFSEYINLTFLF